MFVRPSSVRLSGVCHASRSDLLLDSKCGETFPFRAKTMKKVEIVTVLMQFGIITSLLRNNQYDVLNFSNVPHQFVEHLHRRS